MCAVAYGSQQPDGVSDPSTYSANQPHVCEQFKKCDCEFFLSAFLVWRLDTVVVATHTHLMIDLLPEPRVQASLFSGVCNLLNSIIGAGILSLPFVFKECGLVVGVLSQILFAIMTLHGFRLLLSSLSLTKLSVPSYEGLAERAFGSGGYYAYNTAAFLNCYGACVGYIVVIGDIVPGLLSEIGWPYSDRSLVLAVSTTFVILPLASLRDFSALQYASGSAIVIYLVFAATLLALYIASSPVALDPQPAYFKPSAEAFFRSAPICAFAFQAVTSLFPILQELHNPTVDRMLTLSATSLAIACAVYAVTGWAAYGLFGERLLGDGKRARSRGPSTPRQPYRAGSASRPRTLWPLSRPSPPMTITPTP